MSKVIYYDHGLIITQFSGFGGMGRFQFTITEESRYTDMSKEDLQELIKTLVEGCK